MKSRGQFSIIAALLVAVVLVSTVVVTYSIIRNNPIQEQPPIQSAIDETDFAIKQILGFTVGYYGSVLKVTGNSSYAKMLATNYLRSGLASIANMHPEWATSLDLLGSDFYTCWFTNTSSSRGNVDVTYNLTGLGISGVNYVASCKLDVFVTNTMDSKACLRIIKDEGEPMINLGKRNFKFFRYENLNSTWELINPSSEPIAYANGTYQIETPPGVDVKCYLIQVEDPRGIIVVASSFSSYMMDLTWPSFSSNATSPSSYYVNNDVSNVDSNGDIGTHLNFTAQQYGPDLINDTLTEGNTGAATKYEYYNTGDDNGGEGAWVTDSTFGINSTGSTSYLPVNLGNTNTAGSHPNSQNYLIAVQLTTSSTMTATGVHVYGEAGGNAMISIYSDASNAVGSLLSVSQSTAVANGGAGTTIPIPPVYLSGSTKYWIVYDMNTANAIGKSDTTSYTFNLRQLSSYTYGNSFPAQGSSVTWTAGTFANGYDKIQIVGVGVEGYAKATKAILSDNNASIQSLRFYISPGASGNFRLAIYSDSSGPSSKLWESGSIAAIAGAWNTVTIASGSPTSLTLNSGTYWLVWQWDSANSGPSYMVGSSGDGNYIAQAYGSFPTSWSGGTSSSEKWSIYVNYTASYKLCQTFNSSTSFSIASVKLLLYRTGNPGTVTVGIYATTGNPAYPTGSVLTSGTTNGTTLPTASPYEWREITLTTYTLQANTTYAIVIQGSGGNSGNAVYWRNDATSPTYANGMYGRSASSGAWGTTYMDNMKDNMFEVWATSYNYRLDAEEQWTNVNYMDPNQKYLCIKTGALDAEAVSVDGWNGSGWVSILSSLAANSWNNASVSSLIQSSTFTIRFRDGNINSDSTQNSWNIDATLLAFYGTIQPVRATDTLVIELLQNGTMRWLGQSLQLTTQAKPIPPLPVKSMHLNQTVNGVNCEVPFQIEDWASDYQIPLGLTSNQSVFSGKTMLVFLANSNVSKATLWWNGSDLATQTSYAYVNRYFTGDSPSTGKLTNGILTLQFGSGFTLDSSVGTSSCRATFMRVNGEQSVYGSSLAYAITNGIVRDVIHQEPEWEGGVDNCPNFYAHIVITLPANVTYYTYALRMMFVDSNRNRNITDLCPVKLATSISQLQTENGTMNGYPIIWNGTGLLYNFSDQIWAHHWSQFISASGTKGAGIIFTDKANQQLYVFDNMVGKKTGCLKVDSTTKTIELLPITMAPVNFTSAFDVTWHGAVSTFDSTTPIYQETNGKIQGSWISVEYPPTVAVS
jgi:hypothetical protein